MKKRIFNTILIIILLIIIIGLFLILSYHIKYKCPIKEIFGIYCAGCGATRMLQAIFKFKLHQAFRFNPLVFILLVIGLPYIIYQAILYIKKGTIKVPNNKIYIILVITIILFMILRNISMFDYLKPTII